MKINIRKGFLKPFFAGVVLGIVGLISVLFAIFTLQEWHNEKMWEKAIHSQSQEMDEEKDREEVETDIKTDAEVISSDECEEYRKTVIKSKDFFTFSPSKKYIAFSENVFGEYDCDWDRYWAVKIFYIENKIEKTLLIDDLRMSSYKWLDGMTIRVFHNAGTGIRAYRDVFVNEASTLFSKDYKKVENKTFWKIDEEYDREAENSEGARKVYYELKEGEK